MSHKRNTGTPSWILCVIFNLVVCSCGNHSYKGLMPWDEYKQLSKNEPYVLEIAGTKGKLLYYGSYHTINESHPQFIDIESRWNKFQATIALSEGCIWPLEKTRSKAIKQYGEQGLLRFLAERDNIPVRSIDPPLKWQAVYLIKHFSAEKIKIYYVVRQAIINRRMHKDLSDDRFVNDILQNLKRLSFYQEPPVRLEDFEFTITRHFPEQKDWKNIPGYYLYCCEKGKFLPDIHRKLNDYRNQYMLESIANEIKNGQKVFALVGRSHVVMQEPVLSSIFRSMLKYADN